MYFIRFMLVSMLLMLMACAPTQPSDPATETAVSPEATSIPAEPAATATAAPTAVPTDLPPTEEAMEEGGAESFVDQLQTAVINANYDELPMLVSDPFLVGAWRSEGRVYTPQQLVAEMQSGALPAPTAVQFTGLSEAEIEELLGQPPASLLAPDTNVAAVLHSVGWGAAGEDEAILFVVEQEDGRLLWTTFLYTFGSFSSEEAAGEGFPVVETDVVTVLAMQDVVMHGGPDESYAEIGGIFDGQRARVTGQSPDGNWWRVICPDDTVGDCWVSADPAFTTPSN